MPNFPTCPTGKSINVAIDPANHEKWRCLWASCNTQFDWPPPEEKKP